MIDAGEVSRGEKMAFRGTDPESYITEYTYEDNVTDFRPIGIENAFVARCVDRETRGWH